MGSGSTIRMRSERGGGEFSTQNTRNEWEEMADAARQEREQAEVGGGGAPLIIVARRAVVIGDDVAAPYVEIVDAGIPNCTDAFGIARNWPIGFYVTVSWGEINLVAGVVVLIEFVDKILGHPAMIIA